MSEGQVVSEIYVTPADVSSSVHSISKTVSLPSELTDFIIDHLYDDPKALQNCALVCRSWTMRAYSHLWYQLRFRVKYGRPTWRRLIENIHDSPQIAHHTRRIEIHGFHPRSANRILKSLGIFTNVEALELSALAFPNSDCIPQTISATLTTLLLREVFFQDGDHMYLFIRGFTKLCNLSIHNIMGPLCLQPSPLPPPAECRILHLHRLELAPISTLSSYMRWWLLGLNAEIHVDLLRIGWLCYDPWVPRETLWNISPRVLGPSLKHLEIEISGPVAIWEGANGDIEDKVARIDMSHAVNLLTVTMETNVGYPPATISRLIASTISRVPPSLQTFIFTVSCDHTCTPDGRLRSGVELLSGLDCDLLARAFARFHGVVTIRLLYPAVWDTIDSLTLKTLLGGAHLRLEYVTGAGVVLLYAKSPF